MFKQQLKMKNLLMILLTFILIGNINVTQSQAGSVTFNDNFEGGSINSFWTIIEEFGNAELSSDVAVSGSQSLKLSSFDGGNKNIFANHSFSESLRGSISVWFYDTTVGQYANGSLMQTVDRTTSPAKTNYLGAPDIGDYYYAGNEFSSYRRSIGWHLFELDIDNGTKNYIDGDLVLFNTELNQFDFVSLYTQGMSWQPNATYYFDDFQVNASSVPIPAAVWLLGSGLLGLIGIRRRSQTNN